MVKQTANKLAAIINTRYKDPVEITDLYKHRASCLNPNCTTCKPPKKKTERHSTHYETLPHDNCMDTEHCNCDCDACLDARGGEVFNQEARDFYLRQTRRKK